MIVVDTEFYKSIKEKSNIIERIKRKFKDVKLTFMENMIIYQYDDGRKEC